MSKVADRVRRAALKLRAMDKNQLMRALEKAGIEYTDMHATTSAYDNSQIEKYYNYLCDTVNAHKEIFSVNILSEPSKEVISNDIANCYIWENSYIAEHTRIQAILDTTIDGDNFSDSDIHRMFTLWQTTARENLIKDTPIEIKKVSGGFYISVEDQSMLSEYNQGLINSLISTPCGNNESVRYERLQPNDIVDDKAYLGISWRENGRVYAH